MKEAIIKSVAAIICLAIVCLTLASMAATYCEAELKAAEIAASNIADLRADVEWCGTVASAGSVLALKEYVDRIYASINAVPGVNEVGKRPIVLTATDPGEGSATAYADGTIVGVF